MTCWVQRMFLFAFFFTLGMSVSHSGLNNEGLRLLSAIPTRLIPDTRKSSNAGVVPEKGSALLFIDIMQHLPPISY